MSDFVDKFIQEAPGVISAESVTEGEYIHVYHGEIDTLEAETVRILSLAPDVTDTKISQAFKRKAGQWHNPSTHPNIVTVHDRNTSPRPWLAVEDIDGQQLDDVRGDLSIAEIGTVIADAAEAIRNAGLYNTIHSDLSPEDIWVTRSDGDVTALVDNWGLERVCRVAAGENPLSQYSAPELIKTPDGATEQTDIYGLGAAAYYALTGQPPRSTEDALAATLESSDVVPPSKLNPALTEEIDEVILKALSPAPDERHQSSRSFKTAFTEALPVREDIESTGVAATEDELADEQPHEASNESDSHATTLSQDQISSDRGGGTSSTQSKGVDRDIRIDDDSFISRRRILVTIGVLGVGAVGWFITQSDLLQENSTDVASTTTPVPTATSTPEGQATGQEAGSSDDGQEVGTSDTTETQESTPPPRDINWVPMFRYDAANTGSPSSGTGPTTYLSEVWKFKTGRKVFSSPALVDGVVYVGSDDGYVYSLDAADGTERWSVQTGDSVRSSPTVVDGTVYVGSEDNSLYALDAADGTIQWSVQTSRSVFSSPAVVDDTVYVGSDDRHVYALNATDGTERWSVQTGDSVRSSPAVVDSTVYVGSDDHSIYALDTADGTEQWSFETEGSVQSSPTVMDETIYVGSNDANLYALSAVDDEGNNRREKWAHQIGNRVFSSPAATKEAVVVGSNNGVLALDPSDGTEEWIFTDINGPIRSSPAIVDGTIYFGCNTSANTAEDNTIFGIDASDGEQITQFETFQNVQSSVAIGENTIYVGGDDANVYALTEGY